MLCININSFEIWVIIRISEREIWKHALTITHTHIHTHIHTKTHIHAQTDTLTALFGHFSLPRACDWVHGRTCSFLRLWWGHTASHWVVRGMQIGYFRGQKNGMPPQIPAITYTCILHTHRHTHTHTPKQRDRNTTHTHTHTNTLA